VEMKNDGAFKELVKMSCGAHPKDTDLHKTASLFMGDARFADSRWQESLIASNPHEHIIGPQASEFWSWLGFSDLYERTCFDCWVKEELFNPQGIITVERKGPQKIVKMVFKWRNHETKKLVV